MSTKEYVVPVILAAGQGSRMRSDLPKVLQPLAEKTLIAHVLDCVAEMGAAEPVVVIGHEAERVRSTLPHDCHPVLQAPQQGTGHALSCALPSIAEDATILVLYGDVPLIRPETLSALLEARPVNGLAILTVILKEPHGYGRILRNDIGHVMGIVEERDASGAQRALQEVNTGIMAAPASLWVNWLSKIDDNNDQGEYYLTDCIALAAAEGVPIVAHRCPDPNEVVGVNDRKQLSIAEGLLRSRRVENLMRDGALLRDPDHVHIRGRVRVGRDVVIDTGVVFEGEVTLGDGANVGPFCTLRNAHVGDRVSVLAHSDIDGAHIDTDCRIGPFARLRPGALVNAKAHVGNFVEIKNSQIGEQSKVNHLSYVGDAVVGRKVNVGAGTITANYDGVNKHRTEIDDGASIGSNSVLVAPVKVGQDATIGAGSIITADAPAGKLTLARSRQTTLKDWQRPKRQR